MTNRWVTMLLILACAGTARAGQPGWQQLFDGHDLKGWRQVGDGGFTVQGGLLKAHGGMGLLYWTGGMVGDCEIRVVYRMEGPGSRSAVFIRIPEEPQDLRMAVRRGYEAGIGSPGAGALTSFTKPLASAEKPGPLWNTMVIRLEGRRTQVFVNDVKVTDYTEGQPVPPKSLPDDPDRGLRPDAGWIGLENYGADEVVSFKKVALLKLGAIRPWVP